jgi:3-oxoacyl-[acyl-carrier protein] reductase
VTPTFPDLAGRVAVVTGGSGSIGAATCRLFAANGMRVVAVGRNHEKLAAVPGATPEVVDCTDATALGSLAARHEADVLAVFAGGDGVPEPSLEMSPDRWREVIDGELTSAFLTVRAFVPGMLARGRGSVVLMSSSAGRAPSQANVAYAVAKAGVVMLTRHLAAELGPGGVRVNCLAPSAVHNERMDRAMSPAQIEALGRAFPLGRIGTPDDVAAATAYLASDASGWVTGVTLDISGGKAA